MGGKRTFSAIASLHVHASNLLHFPPSGNRVEPLGPHRSRWLGGHPDDEYDSYLLQAAGRLRDGASMEEVTSYLVSVETEYMGLDEAPEAQLRARETVGALRAYVSELRS